MFYEGFQRCFTFGPYHKDVINKPEPEPWFVGVSIYMNVFKVPHVIVCM